LPHFYVLPTALDHCAGDHWPTRCIDVVGDFHFLERGDLQLKARFSGFALANAGQFFNVI
jgi:hypothetical protein